MRSAGYAVLVAAVIVIGACSTSEPPAGSTPASAAIPASVGSLASGAPLTAQPTTADELTVGPVDPIQIAIDTSGDLNGELATIEDEDRARAREQAGFSQEIGSGWPALADAADQAIDAAAQAVADDLSIELPTSRTRPFATVGQQPATEIMTTDSAASALAIVTASLTAGQSLGQGGTREAPPRTETRTTTEGDDAATVTVTMRGTITSTGSRVVAEFTFELTGTVTNNVSGATAQMNGSATARVEIDGCPDESGSSKGSVSLTSSETARGSGADGGSTTASWTRDLSGEFDISVGDDASISGLAIDAQANESVVSTTQEGEDDDPETSEHELGVEMHYEYSSGPGFEGLAPNDAATTGDVTHEDGATAADLRPLFRSAAYAVSVAAIGLGRDAEAFWRDGKCIELIVDPEGGDVDANSVTSVTATVRHIFEGEDLDKPVEATLTGVTSLDPAGEEQQSPATVSYTAGPEVDDVGEIKFESVSNWGIGSKTIKFTVKATGWTTNADTPLGQIRGLKCDGVGGVWTVEGSEVLVALDVTTVWEITLDESSLEGTYTFEKVQTGLGTVTTATSNGPAHGVLNEDGTVTMTLDAARITLHTENQFGGSGTTTTPGDGRTFQWDLETEGACADE